MTTPKPAPVFDPSVPMTAKWRSDIAWRLADGWTWKELAETLSCDADELRFATECDPEFAAAQEAAWARVTFDGEADAMRRLRLVANTGEGAAAERAREALAKYAAERRHEEMLQTRDRERQQHQREVERIRAQVKGEVEKLRAETKLAVEKLRNERAAMKQAAQRAPEEKAAPVSPPKPAPETDEERAKRLEREHAERAAEPEAMVYVWGGKHPLGRCTDAPDESDRRVRVKADRSRGPRGIVYWVVPDPVPASAAMPGETDYPEALAEHWPGF
jgi:hypothetical protein